MTSPPFHLGLRRWFLGYLLLTGVFAVPQSHAQLEQPPTSDSASEAGPLEYVAPKTFDMLVGLRVTSAEGMANTIATTVFPTDWPEQQVDVVEVSVPSHFRYDLRNLPGDNQQLVFFAPLIPPRTTLEAIIKVRIEKKHTLGPSDPAGLVIPKRLPRELSLYMKDSPYIEASSAEVRKVVRDIESTNPASDWAKIELLYDWVRDNIRYERGELKTVRQAMRDQTGDCEEMTSTFVALCRAARVPARCVWIPNHCYPEFYLQDEAGQGYWFPCQVAGTRNFGSMPEYLPILQKGDRFKVPEKPELQRYLADYLASKEVKGTPQVEFIRQLLGDAASLPTPDLESVE